MAQRIRVTHLLLAGGLMLAAQPAFAQEGMLFKNLLEGTFGSRSAGDDIDYRARPPLVVPPNTTLPPPQDPASTRNAAWPNDPDVQRRKEEATRPIFAQTERARNNPLLSQDELRRGRTSRPEQVPVIAEEHSNYNNQIQPIRIGRELAARRNQQTGDSVVYGEEPPRRMLTEPPTGYRAPAATAAVGPGRNGPVEDKQAVGQREFVTGQGPVMR
ncbi:conserved exported hypothetical protein [Hyphomicrobiales bacterium]|nr:conserved exported hypothetical protein [Hyphomicrobiales bacterium]CAH1696966.1 conserved exported hypothetical protein [Hyphomicrobiales bacterium]CAI0344904.1 conserved exported hypothetical protein [Hyphomicrobiales bacterium]